MLIKITKTHHRALDPRTIKTFCINDVHEFDEVVAQDFIKNDFAIEYKEFKQKIENKAIFEFPEIKEDSEQSLEEKTATKKTTSKKQQLITE